MQVQINAPHGDLPDALVELIEKGTNEGLATFADRLTRVEIHIKDLNAHKGGVDKRCVIEARPRGLDPVAAQDESETVADAFRGALDKMHRVLEKRFGKLARRSEEE